MIPSVYHRTQLQSAGSHMSHHTWPTTLFQQTLESARQTSENVVLGLPSLHFPHIINIFAWGWWDGWVGRSVTTQILATCIQSPVPTMKGKLFLKADLWPPYVAPLVINAIKLAIFSAHEPPHFHSLLSIHPACVFKLQTLHKSVVTTLQPVSRHPPLPPHFYHYHGSEPRTRSTCAPFPNQQ